MPVTYDPSDKMNKKTSVSTNLFLCSKFTIPSILCYLYAHDPVDITDPSSMQDTCHMWTV